MTRPVEYTDLVTTHVEQQVAAPLSDVWELVVSCPELWLGESVRLEMDGSYAVDGCFDSNHAYGRIEEVALLERVVLTWHPEAWDDAALVEVALVEAGPDATRVCVHVEDFPDHVSVDVVARHWQGALDRLVVASAPHSHAA